MLKNDFSNQGQINLNATKSGLFRSVFLNAKLLFKTIWIKTDKLEVGENWKLKKVVNFLRILIFFKISCIHSILSRNFATRSTHWITSISNTTANWFHPLQSKSYKHVLVRVTNEENIVFASFRVFARTDMYFQQCNRRNQGNLWRHRQRYACRRRKARAENEERFP